MRKILTLALALALAVGVRAEFVRPDVAARMAGGLMGMTGIPELQNSSSQHSASRDGQQATPDYYIFNNPQGGWVIIAADDRVTPVLGYSDTGRFSDDDLPDNLSWWMESVAKGVQSVRNSSGKASDQIKAEWDALTAGVMPRLTASEGRLLETAQWDQISPYNQYCPKIKSESERSDAGCIATALSIIMRYNKWPERGNGTTEGYTTYTKRAYISPNTLSSHYYDWDDMPLTDATKRTGWSDSQISKVARVMYDCGTAVQMDYSSEGSSASNVRIAYALKNHFSYSKNVVGMQRSGYTLDQWFSIIKNEIDNGRLVYYTGNGTNYGHAFVCDGYMSNNSMFHINWGWGGKLNGFFNMDLKIPSSYEFSQNQFAVIGIAPDTCNFELPYKEKIQTYVADNSYCIIPVKFYDLTQGNDLRFRIGYFGFNSPLRVKKEFKVCLMDQSGTVVRQEGWYGSITFPRFDEYVRFDTTQTTTLQVVPELTDCFKLFVKDDDGEWVPVAQNRDYYPLLEHVSCGVTPEPLILLPESFQAGQEMELKLSLGMVPVKSVQWKVNGTEYNGTTLVLENGTTELRADVQYQDGTEGTILRTVNVK